MLVIPKGQPAHVAVRSGLKFFCFACHQLIAAASASSDIAAVTDLVNTPAGGGNTALHMAAANGHVAICACLLEAGALTDTKNTAGNTPLHWAALNGHLDVCSLILERGASAFETNEAGQLALDLAISNGHGEVTEAIKVKILQAHDGNLQACRGTVQAVSAPLTFVLVILVVWCSGCGGEQGRGQ
eukprot:SAG31_NODE_7273_length_1737_cov_0.961538_2_plen_186_part_00